MLLPQEGWGRVLAVLSPGSLPSTALVSDETDL